MNGTVKAILGCVATLLILGGLVTYLETRLPSETRDQAEHDSEQAMSDAVDLKSLQKKIKAELEAHGDLLGETARSERWVELIDLAVEDLEAIRGRFKSEVEPLLANNSREDEEQILELLEELFKKREEAMKSVSHLAARVKELAEILPRAAKAYDALGKRLVADKAALSRLNATIDDLAKKTPEVEPILTREKWRPHLLACLTDLAAVAAKHEVLQAKARAHTLAAAKEVLKASEALGADRSRAMARSREVDQQLEALRTFIQKRATYGAQVKADLEALSALAFKEIDADAQKAAARCAFNATEIKRRAVAFGQGESEARRAGERALAELEKPLGAVNPALVVKSVDLVHKRRAKAPQVVTAFKAQLADLDRSYEKVLVDMEIKEGYEVTFHQEFLEVTARRGQAAAKVTRAWKTVKEAEYKRLESWLGMTVAHKPYGFFTDQTERSFPAPAGMAYVGNPAYGAWSGEKWVFNTDDQTKLLVASAWSTHYPSHTRNDQQSFQRRKAPWIGVDRWGHAAYGSKGSLTQLIYAKSRYVRAKGYGLTRYKKSGGRYRGSRYEQSRSRTVFVGGSRSSGSSRGSSRSSWGK